MSDMMEVMDQQGRKFQIPRTEYSKQMMSVARQNWNSIDALRHFTVQMLSEGFFPEALQIADQACRVSNNHVPDLYWRASALAENGKFDEAAKVFEELIEDAAYPADVARSLIGLARVRARQTRTDEVLPLLESAIEADPGNHQVLLQLHSYLTETGRAEESLKRLRDAANAEPKNAAPSRALAHAALQEGDKDELKRRINEALERISDENQKQDFFAEASAMYGQASMPQEIIHLIEPQIESVHQPFALVNLAHAMHEVGRKDHAKQLLESIRQAAPPELRPMVEQRIALLSEADKGQA
jgi:tetratricopeptide (TPR) repeat protein